MKITKTAIYHLLLNAGYNESVYQKPLEYQQNCP
jgi:hypothetical protein